MTAEKLSFTVGLAGVPIGIRCVYKSNERFFEGYYTDKAPVITVEPGEEDLVRIEGSIVRSALAEGREPVISGAFTENCALHDLIAEALPAHGVLLMHGSALALDGEAYVFTAPSGTGKSTHTRFWREAFGERCVMIDDDKPLIAVSEDGIRVFGTPWNGKHRLGANISAPLRAIIRLGRGDENAVSPLPAGEAFTMLLSRVYSSRNADTMRRIAALIGTLTKSAAFYDLRCNLDPQSAMIAYRGITGGTGER